MVFVSLTRLRVRSVWFMPEFFLYAIRSQSQVRKAAGFQSGALLPDRDRTFWTMTAWESEASMRAYMISGAHKAAMPKLLHWCDEASVAHWTQGETALPSWEQADERMRKDGRASKVLHPSAAHASLSYKVPRTSGSAPIRPG
ncbi:heme-degrading monooxygenase HmoA [Granulicella aggregans]|uniref:Heme-degrading monooxygenase HmoA n=1 Tax=Granulicella aggregans TaxID=474949 RepID=A0A7W7ZCG8_9BACT|nr:antibiotic biosynthesis monooxygenase [Granulicella aggregans]MBB5057351.1 heme-degrading monooxygenase HmoA [Granulicella aggregans]